MADNYFHEYMKAINNPLPELDNTFDEEIKYLKQHIEKIRKNNHQAEILEIGCGCARPLESLAKEFPECNFTGTDISKKAITKTKRKIFNVKNITILTDDFRNTKLNKKYDFIYSTFNLIGSIKIKDRSLLIKKKKELSLPHTDIITITWNRDEYTTHFLKNYYKHIGCKIYKLDATKTKTNKGILYRVNIEEIKGLYEKNNLPSYIKQVGNLWIAISTKKGN